MVTAIELKKEIERLCVEKGIHFKYVRKSEITMFTKFLDTTTIYINLSKLLKTLRGLNIKIKNFDWEKELCRSINHEYEHIKLNKYLLNRKGTLKISIPFQMLCESYTINKTPFTKESIEIVKDNIIIDTITTSNYIQKHMHPETIPIISYIFSEEEINELYRDDNQEFAEFLIKYKEIASKTNTPEELIENIDKVDKLLRRS